MIKWFKLKIIFVQLILLATLLAASKPLAPAMKLMKKFKNPCLSFNQSKRKPRISQLLAPALRLLLRSWCLSNLKPLLRHFLISSHNLRFSSHRTLLKKELNMNIQRKKSIIILKNHQKVIVIQMKNMMKLSGTKPMNKPWKKYT